MTRTPIRLPLALIAAPLALLAHTISTTRLELRAPGDRGSFTVFGQGCLTDYSVSVLPPPVVSVAPSTPTRSIDQTYTVTGLQNGSTTVRVIWAGVSDNCRNEADVFNVIVTVGQGSQPTAPATDGGPNSSNAGTTNDPISTATGELFVLDETPDLAWGGLPPLSFRRYYASYLQANNITSALGANWMHNFDVKLTATATTAAVTLFRGKQVRFNLTVPGWQQASPEKRNYQLATVAGGFQFLDSVPNLIYSFSTTGALTRIEDRNGNAQVVSQSPSSLGPERVSDGLGRSLTFSYAGGRLTRVEDQTGRSVSFTHTGENLATVTDPNGRTTTFSYTSSGGLTLTGLLGAETLPAGNRPYTQEYDAQGRVIRQLDSRGNATTLLYNTPSAGRTTVRNPLNASTVHLHQGPNNLTSWTDAAGNSSFIDYDSRNHPSSMIDRRGNRTTFTYDGLGNLTSVTDPLGNTTRYHYLGQVQGSFFFFPLAGIDFPDGATARMSHDGRGNLLSLTHRAGKVWTFTYNNRGQVLTMRNPADGLTTHTYNNDGTRASATLHSGERITFEYDAQRRLARTNWPDGTSRQFSYDNHDRLLTVTDERGKRVGFAYNDNGQLQSVTDPANQTMRLGYDTDERWTSTTDRLGNVFRRSFDEVGRPRSFANPAGDTLTFVYDALGRVTSVSDSGGQRLSLAYDAEDSLLSLADGTGNAWRFTPDAMGRLSRASDPLGRATSFTYDSRGRLTSLTDPLSQVTQFVYDPRGLLTGLSLPAGISASFTRNNLGQVSAVTDPNRNTWTRNYDAMGRLVSKRDPLGRVTYYSYDNRRRVRQVDLPEGMLAFTYDGAGNLLRRQYSDGTDIQYAYDDNNRVVTATGVSLAYDARGRIVASNGLAITRDSVGRIAAVTYAPGKTVRYEYNSQGLLVRITDWVGGATELAYDGARRLVSVRRPNSVTTQYTYAADSRLAAVTETGGAVNASISLSRDAAGRIATAARNVPRAPALVPGVQQFSFDAAHQVSGFAYDRLGRLISDGRRTYRWDLASRLQSFADGGSSGAFGYDAFSLLVTGWHNYVWNYALALPSIAVSRMGQADARYYIHLPTGILLYSVDAADNRRRFFHFDEIGSTVFLSDDRGNVTDSYAITPYGEVVSRSGDTDNPFTFLGAFGVLELPGTGLYYMRARFYDSTAARFLTADPVLSLEPRSINPYQYARASPLRFIDPTGLSPTTPSRTGFRDPGGGMTRIDPPQVGTPGQAESVLDELEESQDASQPPADPENNGTPASGGGRGPSGGAGVGGEEIGGLFRFGPKGSPESTDIFFFMLDVLSGGQAQYWIQPDWPAIEPPSLQPQDQPVESVVDELEDYLVIDTDSVRPSPPAGPRTPQPATGGVRP